MDDLNDVVDSVIAPEALMPVQWAAMNGGMRMTPHGRLALAIILDAARIVKGKRPKDNHRAQVKYDEALAWLKDDGDHVCSFRFWAACFGVDDCEGWRRKILGDEEMKISRLQSVGRQEKVASPQKRRSVSR